ncbi:MAG: glycosyltransferase family 39 protein [Myxococcales bacterium]|nr:glycosyltransferase family 39 protein [Myxococcales bacterium]
MSQEKPEEIRQESTTETPPPPVDETFDYVEFEKKSPQRLSRWFWLQWCVLLGIGFAMLSILSGGFANMHEYGWSDAGENRVLLISKNEMIFAVGLLAMLPLVVFLVIGAEHWLAGPLGRLVEKLAQPRRRRLVVVAAMMVAGALLFGAAKWVLDYQPVTDDENVYLFQSRILAAGQLALPSLPDVEPLRDRIFEDNIFLVNNGKIFGQYPVGQSIALLPGYLAGWPHLMPLVFAVFSILGLYLLGSRLYGPKGGLLAAVLLAISPTFLATSATLLSHSTTLCCLIWFFYFAHRTWKETGWVHALLAGFFFLVCFQVRSATTLLAAGPVGIALAVFLLRDIKRQWLKILLLALLVGLTIGISLYFNYQINGDYFKTNYHAAWGEGRTPFKHPFGFGKGAWHMVHSPAQGFWSAWDNLLRLNWWLLGWPISLLFVIAWLLRRDKKSLEWLGFSTVLLTFFAYYFYFWPGVSDTGPVLYYELLAVLILLTVSGIEAAPRLLLAWMPRQVAARRVMLFIVFSCLAAFFTFHQYNARALHRVAENVAQLEKALEDFGVPDRAVIFTNYYLKNTTDKNYQDSWVVGRPMTSRLLGDKQLFYVNYGRTRDEEFAAKYHPGLPAYVVTWNQSGRPEVVRLEDYQVALFPDNFPDSR